MREEIRNIQERIGITTIFVTHDQYEAMSISDRLLVLHDGVIQQIGSPIDIYERPANEFIAGFVGYVNFLEATVDAIDEQRNVSYVSTEYGKLELIHDQEDVKVGDKVVLVIRPETVSLSPSHGTERTNTFHGTVESSMYAGNLAKYTVKFGDKEMVVDHYNPMGSEKFSKNDKVKVTVPREIHVLKR
jgi:ABC-type Fe3+/spermidine/putrescine transport system ATPase subunit